MIYIPDIAEWAGKGCVDEVRECPEKRKALVEKYRNDVLYPALDASDLDLWIGSGYSKMALPYF